MEDSVRPLLSIITVVRDDAPGLSRTVESLRFLPAGSFEHVVIDGSSNDDVLHLALEATRPHTTVLHESDSGIYEAMNKGLDRFKGRFCVFVNAGDCVSSHLNWLALEETLEVNSGVVFAYTIERFRSDSYLRPGLGREQAGPFAHPATFYPRAFACRERYRLDMPVAADGEYTGRSMSALGWVFVPAVFAEFELGGVSSTYDSASVLKSRIRETRSTSGRSRLIAKYVLWRIVPTRWFYRILGSRKYTKLPDNPTPILKTLIDGP